ncbi:MAG: hypothetical protein QM817_41030 [Archangium sp.]
MDATTLISKLQSEDGSRALAKLSVEALLAQPLETLLPREALRAGTRKVLEAWLAAPEGAKAIDELVERVVNELQAQSRSVKDVAPREATTLIREVLGRPFSPDRRVVLTVIDRPPMRELVRQLLLTAILDFGRKASAPVAGVARGLGSLAKLAGETVKSRTGGLGSLVGAVSGEVERQVEKRAVDFVDAALGGVFGQIADALSDPARAHEASELRQAFFDGLIELTGTQLAREVMNSDVAGGAELIRSSLKRWLASDAANTQLDQLAALTLKHDGARPANEVLKQLGVLEVTIELGTEHLARHIRTVTATPAFATWLSG